MNIAIASGKGGTGKTTVAINIAESLTSVTPDVSLLDCDVEEPNCHLFLTKGEPLVLPVNVNRPVWDRTLCNSCGKCAEACAFNAVAVIKDNVLFIDEMCKSCGLCGFVCPRNAISEKPFPVGNVKTDFKSHAFGFVQGTLNIGEAMALPVIKAVLKHLNPAGINILDAAPGTGCPVVEVLEKADAAVLVTEPTPFGLHDLKLATALALKLKVPTGIIINRSCGEDALIDDFAGEVDIPIIGRIPFKRQYAEAYSQGKLLVREFPGLKIKMLQFFEKIKDLAETRPALLFELPSPACQIPASRIGDVPAGRSIKEVTILSGKGGTGKTTIAASLAKLASNQVMADTDVDAPDLHLLLKPTVLSSADFTGGKKALIDSEKCTACGECVKVCRFDAINSVELSEGKQGLTVNSLACEGCGFCEIVCPAAAIEMKSRVAGNASLSSTAYGPMTHALLDTGQENSGKLVSRVRQLARKTAQAENHGLIQVDGPPGTGCPVIASLGGTNLALVITEPTVSGLHDMKRVLLLAKHFNIPTLLVINKSDLNRKLCNAIHQTAGELGTRVVAEIPFDRNVHDALMRGKILADYKGPAAEAVNGLWATLQKELKSLKGPKLKIPV